MFAEPLLLPSHGPNDDGYGRRAIMPIAASSVACEQRVDGVLRSRESSGGRVLVSFGRSASGPSFDSWTCGSASLRVCRLRERSVRYQPYATLYYNHVDGCGEAMVSAERAELRCSPSPLPSPRPSALRPHAPASERCKCATDRSVPSVSPSLSFPPLTASPALC